MREQREWERTRFVSFSILKSVGAKINSPQSLLPLPLVDGAFRESEKLEREEFERSVKELVESPRIKEWLKK